MRKLLLATVMAAGLLAVGAGTAGAVDYPATTGTLTVTADGNSARIEGCGFAPGATVQIKVDGADAGTTTASAEGCISTTVSASGGSTVIATGLNPQGGTLTLSGTVSSSSGFAFTGANTGLLVGVAIAILAVGGLFVVVTRRRAVTG
ncbi:MAG: hypothetical protein FJW88_06950 [Actinobacteria bacterium]|nr:hypothetical protein [Actinomycetota bacterium]